MTLLHATRTVHEGVSCKRVFLFPRERYENIPSRAAGARAFCDGFYVARISESISVFPFLRKSRKCCDAFTFCAYIAA